LHYLSRSDRRNHQIAPLSLHDALPIYHSQRSVRMNEQVAQAMTPAPASNGSGLLADSITVTYRNGHTALRDASFALPTGTITALDRKSTRLNSSHVKISYAVFCLKKKR